MRLVTTALIAVIHTACTRGSETASAPPVDPALVQFLLSSAADDFRSHPPEPARFRNVRLGHTTDPNGEKQYRICGEFLPRQEDGKADWTPFVTIKTSGYEQYIGGPGEMAYCSDKVTWNKEGDLTAALQGKYDSLTH